ncbi:MAG: DUF192 domain-containing protein [Deltaproteobacteria bacterium]|nr:DUF192 domain-containing protein [Deltaproteobacteria bacterium]
MFFRIENKKEGKIVAEKAMLADTFFSRLKGLLGTKKLDKGEALILEPCQSVHTFFMKYDLDIIFLNKENIVIGVAEHLKPNRLSAFYRHASKAVELPSGSIVEGRVTVGEKLEFIQI